MWRTEQLLDISLKGKGNHTASLICYCYPNEYIRKEFLWKQLTFFSFVIIMSTVQQSSFLEASKKEIRIPIIRRSSLSIWEMLDWIQLYTFDTHILFYAQKDNTLKRLYIDKWHNCIDLHWYTSVYMHAFMCVKVDWKEKWSRCVVWLSWLSIVMD